MPGRNQHVLPFGNGWVVQTEGQKTISIITSRQSDAISFARDIARKEKTEVFIHGRNGKVREKNNFRDEHSSYKH
jgi:hypothetical protein